MVGATSFLSSCKDENNDKLSLDAILCLKKRIDTWQMKFVLNSIDEMSLFTNEIHWPEPVEKNVDSHLFRHLFE